MSFLLIVGSANSKTTAELVLAVVALGTLIKGTLEYVKQGAQKRTELFLRMRDRYDKFLDLCTLLEHQSEPAASKALRSLPFDKKNEFLGFYEEIALMTRSGLKRPAVAHYMFGYFALRCWECDDFWSPSAGGPNRDSRYWEVFRRFTLDMQKEEKKFLAKKKFQYQKYRL